MFSARCLARVRRLKCRLLQQILWRVAFFPPVAGVLPDATAIYCWWCYLCSSVWELCRTFLGGEVSCILGTAVVEISVVPGVT